MGEYTPGNVEVISKKFPVFAVCANGNGRSKVIARILSSMGFDKSYAIGVNNLSGLSDELQIKLEQARALVFVNTDILTSASHKAPDY